MKRLTMTFLVMAGLAVFSLGAVAMSFGPQFGGYEQRTTWTIHADGKSEVRSETIMSRAGAEQMLQMAEMFEEFSRQNLTDEVEAEEPEADDEPEAMADEQLAERIRALIKEDGDGVVEALEVDAENVRTVTVNSFETLETALGQSLSFLHQTGVGFANVRFATNEEGQLRLRFTPQQATRFTRQATQMWKSSGMKTEFKLVLPGPILTSDFPQTEGNTTGYSIDAEDAETLDAAVKLLETPSVIVAESGGLTLERPLDARAFRHAARDSGQLGADLPITDAGPGFVAEATTVTTSTLYYFPEGEKRLKGRRLRNVPQPGVQVEASLFAPRGRTVQSTTGIVVREAFDDQGRSVLAHEEEGDDWDEFGRTFHGSSSRQSESARIQLRLPLPQPDAQSIEEVSAEAIVVTAGNWKEMTLPEVEADPEKTIDLSEVLPGATVVIHKSEFNEGRIEIEVEASGPAEVRHLNFECKLAGTEHFHSYTSRTRATQNGDRWTRRLTVQGFAHGEGARDAALSLVVRSPEDIRRERVQFTLTGLDLF